MFLKTKYFIYGKWAGNTPGMSRIYLEVVSDLKSVLKSQFWVSKLDFLTCESGNTEGPSILRTCASGLRALGCRRRRRRPPDPPGGPVFPYFQIHRSPEWLVLQYFQIHRSKNQVLKPQNWLFRTDFKSETTSKYILDISWVFPALFSYVKH